MIDLQLIKKFYVKLITVINSAVITLDFSSASTLLEPGRMRSTFWKIFEEKSNLYNLQLPLNILCETDYCYK